MDGKGIFWTIKRGHIQRSCLSAFKDRFRLADDSARTYKNYIDSRTYDSYTGPAMTTTLAPATLAISEAAERLGVHQNTVRNWIDQGLLNGYRTPTGRRKLRLDSVERLEREMFGVPFPAVELREPKTAPQQANKLTRAQSKLP
jgi:excisionase family DNA binding protein